jgi:hypothetical protein
MPTSKEAAAEIHPLEGEGKRLCEAKANKGADTPSFALILSML